MREPQRSRRLRRYDRRDYQKHNSIAASFSQDYSSAASSRSTLISYDKQTEAEEEDWAPPVENPRQCRNGNGNPTTSGRGKERCHAHEIGTVTMSLNERVRLRAKEHQQQKLNRGRPRFPSRGRPHRLHCEDHSS